MDTPKTFTTTRAPAAQKRGRKKIKKKENPLDLAGPKAVPRVFG